VMGAVGEISKIFSGRPAQGGALSSLPSLSDPPDSRP